MQAAVRYNYGNVDKVQVAEIDKPEPGKGQVGIEVNNAGLDRGIVHMLTGVPQVMRLGTGLRKPSNPLLGIDFLGQVNAVGEGVTGFETGQLVYGNGVGTLAEYAIATPKQIAVVYPETLDYSLGILPVSGCTALQALRDQAKVEPGQRVLINGASGGVGTFAVQLAKLMGCEVVAVASSAKAERLEELEPDRIIRYDREPLPASGDFDAILDIGGMVPISTLRRALSPTGTLVLIGGEGGSSFAAGLGRQVGGMVSSVFSKQKVKMFVSSTRTNDLETLADYVTSGRLKPVIGQTVSLGEVPQALGALERGEVFGKVLVDIA